MGAAKKIIVWLALIVLMIVSASANIPREAETRVWEKIGLGVESCQINELEASHWELDRFELRLEVAVNPLLVTRRTTHPGSRIVHLGRSPLIPIARMSRSREALRLPTPLA
jgi:hypothetical protein